MDPAPADTQSGSPWAARGRRLAGICLTLIGFAGLLFQALTAGAPRAGGLVSLGAGCVMACGVALLAGAPAVKVRPAGSYLVAWRLARAAGIAVAVLLGLIAVFVYAHNPPANGRGDLIDLAFAGAFAGAVGYAELTQRYRDDPVRLLAADPTIIYVSVNVAAAVGALALVREFNVFDSSNPHHEFYGVLLASFGSIAFFRSSLFTARVGDKDMDVGPSTLLKSLLNTSDTMINRSQARDRADDAAVIMQQVDFAKAKVALPSLCFTVVENVTQEDQDRIGRDIIKLASAGDMSDRQRSIILGTYLMRVVGPLVLARAVVALGESIAATAPPAVVAR